MQIERGTLWTVNPAEERHGKVQREKKEEKLDYCRIPKMIKKIWAIKKINRLDRQIGQIDREIKSQRWNRY